jgi:hypothetical protein
MNTLKKLLAFAAVIAVIGLSTVSGAGGGQDLAFMPTKDNPKAAGKINLSSDKLKIRAEGLKPDFVYTVWFVNMKPKKDQAGAGSPPFMFKTDSQGKGAYGTSLAESPIGKWATTMVVLHPTGDPKDMKNMVPAFSVMIPASDK